MNTLKKIMKNPYKIFGASTKYFKYKYLPDDIYLKLLYRCFYNKKLNLRNPQTFNEKLQWLKLYDRNPMYTKLVDKYEVKKYVSSLIGEDYIIKTLGVWDSFNDIDFKKLPDKFVIKCTHDSGGVVVVKDKNKMDINAVKLKLEKCLKKNFFYMGREWPYKNVTPRIIVEELIEDNTHKELKDYKLMCFNGKVECSFVCSDRFSGDLRVTFFDREWRKMPFERHYPKADYNIDKPVKYEEMIKIAEILSHNIPFVRMDFYEVEGKIYFGEFTFYPGSGFEEFTPEEWDYKLGNLIKLPER